MTFAPRIVERYAIYEEIASGGMASVHFARLAGPSGSGRTVAAKRAHPHLARDPDFTLMFLDEARLASRVRHPNVVPTIDVLSTRDDLVLVMEYVHGESLWKLMRGAQERGDRVPAPIAATILVDALHGLHAAHEATDERGEPLRIVHRDVSPHNILVGVDGVSRLVDFGIAKAAGRLHSTQDSAVKGKFAYMAPEQVRGETVSRLTDTYAAAIVFWELLTGERLFVGKTDAETIHKCLVGRIQAPSLVAPELGARFDGILKKGLSRDPAGRYQTAREMAVDIESSIETAPASEVGAWVERIAGDALASRAATVAQIEQGEEAAPPARSRRRAIVAAVVLAGLTAAIATGRARSAALREPATAAAPEASASVPVPGSVPASVSVSGSVPVSAPVSASVSVSVPVPAPVAATPSVSPPPPPTRASPRSSPARSGHTKRRGCDPPYSVDSEGRQIFKPECM